MDKENDIISYDFQGWPNYKRNLREILTQLGAVTKGKFIGFNIKDPILDVYPIVLEDDGMAYGVNPKYITDTDVFEDKSRMNMFVEPVPKNETKND